MGLGFWTGPSAFAQVPSRASLQSFRSYLDGSSLDISEVRMSADDEITGVIFHPSWSFVANKDTGSEIRPSTSSVISGIESLYSLILCRNLQY